MNADVPENNVAQLSGHRNLKRLDGYKTDEGPMLETLDHTIRIGSTPTFLYFDLYLYSAYAAHYVYFKDVNGLESLSHDHLWKFIDV